MAGQNIPPHHLFCPHLNPIHVEVLAAQRLRIQALRVENQQLATTDVAIEQQLALSHQTLYHLSSTLTSVKQQGDAQVQKVYEKAVKIEGEVRVYREYEVELGRVRDDVRKMEENKRELEAKLAEVEAEVRNVREEAREVKRVKEEIEVMRRELCEGM
nr:PREDICTED: protein FLC EXPRESSOR-like [Daucus carota subsp. sativus]